MSRGARSRPSAWVLTRRRWSKRKRCRRRESKSSCLSPGDGGPGTGDRAGRTGPRMSESNAPPAARTALLYHYCRMQLPAVVLAADRFVAHLVRTFNLFAGKSGPGLTWEAYFDQLYALDWYLCSGCLENDNRAWEALFATR